MIRKQIFYQKFAIFGVLVRHVCENISNFAPEIQILEICTRNF